MSTAPRQSIWRKGKGRMEKGRKRRKQNSGGGGDGGGRGVEGGINT
jgi:hypothetical protein